MFLRDENGEVLTDSVSGGPILVEPEFGSGQQDTLIELGMTSFTYQNNGGVGTPPPATTDPTIDTEFYNVLRGLWRDGTAVTFGGSGFDPASTDTVQFTFPDVPSDVNGWSMCSENLPFGDRRTCLLYTSPSPRDRQKSRMPSSA